MLFCVGSFLYNIVFIFSIIVFCLIVLILIQCSCVKRRKYFIYIFRSIFGLNKYTNYVKIHIRVFEKHLCFSAFPYEITSAGR